MKIIRIISNYSVLIDVGYAHDVAENDEFQIYIEGPKIFHPDTNEFLGTLDYIKANIIAKTVYENMAICISNEFEEVINPLSNLSVRMAEAMGYCSTQNRKKLNVRQEDINGYEIDINRSILIGDPVKFKPSNKNSSDNETS